MLESEDQGREKLSTDSKGTPPQDIIQPIQERSLPPTSPHRSFSSVAKGLVAAILAVIGLMGGIYEIFGGPPWPTSPDVIPGPPDNSQAFNVPFTLRNRSSFFPEYIEQSSCTIDKARFKNGLNLKNMKFISREQTTIKPLESRPFLCFTL